MADMFPGIQTVSLSVPFDLMHQSTPCQEGTELCELLVELARKIIADERVYFGVVEGEYAGSIFYLEPKEGMMEDRGYGQPGYWKVLPTMKAPFGRASHSSWNKQWQWDTPTLYGRMRFDGRKNKPMFDVRINGQAVYLPNYNGPTVYKKFDKAAAEKAIIEEIEITDRNGVVLAEGDSVIYVNLRYGSGGQLDYGTIKSIRVKAQKSPRGKDVHYEVNVVIKNRDADEESTIRVPNQLIIKEMK